MTPVDVSLVVADVECEGIERLRLGKLSATDAAGCQRDPRKATANHRGQWEFEAKFERQHSGLGREHGFRELSLNMALATTCSPTGQFSARIRFGVKQTEKCLPSVLFNSTGNNHRRKSRPAYRPQWPKFR